MELDEYTDLGFENTQQDFKTALQLEQEIGEKEEYQFLIDQGVEK